MILAATASLVLLSSCKRAPEPFDATVEVDVSQVVGQVPRFLLGQNTEAGDNFGIFGNQHSYDVSRTGSGLWLPDQQKPDPRMEQAAKDVGLSVLRFPGGCLSHSYDWKKAIGPVKDRPNFAFGIDEFIGLCRKNNIEPLMTIADYVGGPQEAAELVEYLNAPADNAHPWALKRAQFGH